MLNAGDLDPTFGMGGKVLADFTGPIGARAAGAVLQPDGKIVVAGTGYQLAGTGNQDFLLARYNPDGSVDATFGNSGQVITEFFGYGQALALQPDGKIVVVGGHQGSSANSLFGVARYTATGGLDPTFGNGGTVSITSGVPSGVAIQPDGKIIVVGNRQMSGDTAAVVVRYMSDGSLDPSFGMGGEVIDRTTSTESVVIQPDGKIIVAGSPGPRYAPYVPGSALLRYNADGRPDTAFNANAANVLTFSPYRNTSFGSAILQGDGKILLAGYIPGFLGQADTPLIVRLNADGSLDSSFGTKGRVVAGVSTDGFALAPDGKIVVAGAVPHPLAPPPPSPYAIERYNADGSSDTNFGAGGSATLIVAPAGVVTQADGKIVVVGTSFELLRLTSSGDLDPGFGAGGEITTSFVATVNSEASGIAVQADGKIILVGRAGDDIALVRYSPNGGLDRTFGSGGRVVEHASHPISTLFTFVGVAVQSDDKILVETADMLLRYTADGSLDPSFGTGGKIIYAAGFRPADPVVQPDGKILVLGPVLSRYNPDGTLDRTFGMAGSITNLDTPTGVTLQPDGRILVSQRRSDDALTILIRYQGDGTLDTSFGNGGMVSFLAYQVSGIAIQPDGKIVLGGPVARLNPDGSLDPLFGMSDFTDGGKVVLMPNGQIVVGGNALYLYKPNGTLNLRFGNAGMINPDFDIRGYLIQTDFIVQADGKIVVAGTTKAGGHTSFTVARYVTTGGSSLTPNQLFIAQAYLDLVRRPADPGGLALWSNLLDRGWSRMQVVQQMQTSQEYHTVVVRDLYRRVLGRFPDSAGANAWIDFLNRGGTAEQLEAFLLGSDEFFITHGSGNNQGFLSALYQNVLQRPIDPSGADSWGQALANGTSRAAVAAAVLASLEADRVETQTTYAKLLHRPPDPSGLDTFTYLLQQGVPNETVIAIIMSSDEYFAQI